MTTIDEEDKENYGIEKYDNNINGGCEEETKYISLIMRLTSF